MFDLFDDCFAFVQVAYRADHMGSGGVHSSQSLDSDA